MLKLSIQEIIKNIENEKIFEAVAEDNSFEIKINRYVPCLCTAIHAGHNFRDELKDKCTHSEYERWFEEDPHTDDFILALPITLIGKDSRFEYDLNRSPENCIYDEAWGKKVWKEPLNSEEIKESLKKHSNYYKVTHALISKLEEKFDACTVFDMHAYNYKRWERDVPTFNIGCELVDTERYGKYIQDFNYELNQIISRGKKNNSAINDVFQGKGYNLAYITKNFKNTLVLATEIKKIYCNELTGESYPEEVKHLKKQLKKAMLKNGNFFSDEETNWQNSIKNQILTKDINKGLFEVDEELYNITKDFELLTFVNPINLNEEEKIFFKNKCQINPQFKYKPILIDPFKIKRKLYNINIDKIEDVTIQKMYEAAINAFVDKTDMLANLGREKFLFNSLRYFGRPSQTDIRNANYLLSLPKVKSDHLVQQKLFVDDAIKAFEESFESYGFKGNIEVNDETASEVMVINSQKKVVIKEGSEFNQNELDYLVHHEIGVHMVTTMNSLEQPLKIFNLGLPVNTKTQEGLAILAEYLSGNISLDRLRTLALRVIAIDMMCSGSDFKETFNFLVNEHNEDKRTIFNLVARVYRGGGFTKDYLYLAGFVEIYKLWKTDYNLNPLLIGKTSLKYYNTIVEMTERGFLTPPKHITECITTPCLEKNDSIFEYIIDGLI